MTHLLRSYDRGVLRVTINRPAKRNALARETLRELRAVFAAHAAHAELRLALIAGAGDLAFCAGADLLELQAARAPEEAAAIADEGAAALDAVRSFPVPTVAALNGFALGGGAELALACDLRVAAPHARIGFTHAELALTSAWGGGPDLVHAVGTASALELLASARVLPAEAARAVGLVQHVAPREAPFVAFVDRLAAMIAGRPPHLLRAFKALVLAARRGADPDALRAVERDGFERAWGADAHRAAIEAWAAARS
ncbi:MAG: enoyl-CoA hydratase/isomerase family protein [Burkholderiales bacterium]